MSGANLLVFCLELFFFVLVEFILVSSVKSHYIIRLETKCGPASAERNRIESDANIIVLSTLKQNTGSRRFRPKAKLFSDAESGKDQIDNVIGGGLAG